MAILRRKYGLSQEIKSSRTAQEEMDYLEIPESVQESVKNSLHLAGKNASEKLVQTLLLEQCAPGTQTWSNILQSVNLDCLEEVELCKIFGLDPMTLKQNFGLIFQDILKVFNFFDPKNSMSDQGFQTKDIKTDSSDITTDRCDKQVPDIKTIIRLMVHLYEKLNNRLAFSKNTLIRLPYTFEGNNGILINFNSSNGFEIITNNDINIEAFSSIRINFSFCCHLEQMIIFENVTEIEGLHADVASQMPPFFQFNEIILHNFRNTALEIHKNSKIGILSIKTFSNNTTFLPLRVDNVHFMSMKNAFQDHNNSMLRFDLSTKICKMFKESSPMFRQENNIEAAEPFTLQSKQILITSLV
jgi:hypothetical protein